MDAEEVAKTIPEWATEMVGYLSRFGPFRDCFALVALRSLKSMKSHPILLATKSLLTYWCQEPHAMLVLSQPSDSKQRQLIG